MRFSALTFLGKAHPMFLGSAIHARLLESLHSELERRLEPQLARGDGVLFPSEMRHNVTTLVAGERRSLVIELWDGPACVYNRHR